LAQEYVNLQGENIQSQVSRRSRMETFCDILRAIGAGAEKPTHIMYKANLSWTVMQNYIKSLETQGLVVSVSDQGKRLYHLSDKGFQLLKQFLTIREDLNLPNES
jgi:predicted transcriptional regulator